jgi:hypothetical protein
MAAPVSRPFGNWEFVNAVAHELLPLGYSIAGNQNPAPGARAIVSRFVLRSHPLVASANDWSTVNQGRCLYVCRRPKDQTASAAGLSSRTRSSWLRELMPSLVKTLRR